MVFIRAPKELALIVMSQRKKLKRSQLEVGSAVGLKQSTISAFENKPGSTQLETLFRILSALNLDMQLTEKDQLDVNKAEWKDEW